MKNSFLQICFVAFLSFTACETESVKPLSDSPADPLSELIAAGEVSGDLNPFPLVENPPYRPVYEIDFMQDDELVFISKSCGFILVYPLRSMYVEVVNEAQNGVFMAVTYCPITRSGISINRIQERDTLLLTASGYLFRENLLPLDLHSGSLFSQMQLKGISGAHQAEQFETFPLIETTWGTVREHFPSALIYIVDGFRKSRDQAPESIGQGPQYEQPYGILGRSGVELFRLDMFPGEVKLISTTVQPGGKTIVAGSSKHHFIVAYQTTYPMEAVEGQFPVIMKDEKGTLWNLFGEAVSGVRGGEKLQAPLAYTAADWAWKAHFDQVRYHIISP